MIKTGEKEAEIHLLEEWMRGASAEEGETP